MRNSNSDICLSSIIKDKIIERTKNNLWMPVHPSANQKQSSLFSSWFLSMTLIASRSYTVISAACGDVHPRGINAYQPSGSHPHFTSFSFSFVCLSLPFSLSSLRSHSTLWSCAHCIAKQALVPTNKHTAFYHSIYKISAFIANAYGINKERFRGQRCSFLPGDFNDTVVRCTDAGGPTMRHTSRKTTRERP